MNSKIIAPLRLCVEKNKYLAARRLDGAVVFLSGRLAVKVCEAPEIFSEIFERFKVRKIENFRVFR